MVPFFFLTKGDVPLHKVKFDANQEFMYIQNFKILQLSFTKHNILNVCPLFIFTG